MGMIDIQYRTLTCNGPECTKTSTFEMAKLKEAIELPENSWIKSARVVNSPDGRVLVYCSDVCEVKGIATGQHNLPEVKRIIDTSASPAQVAQAAAAAAAAKAAEVALKGGRPVQGLTP